MTRYLPSILPVACVTSTDLRLVQRGELAELSVDAVAIGSADYHVKPEHFVVSGFADWGIRSIVIDGREQLDQELEGRLFSREAPGEARWLDTLRNGSTIHVAAIYQGDAPGGRHFQAAFMGVEVSPSHGSRAFSGSVRLREEGTGDPIAVSCDGPERVLPGQSAWFVARAQDRVVKIERIVIDLASEEWSIEDIMAGGRSQLMRGGPVPGEVFAPEVRGVQLALEPGNEVAIRATYCGKNARGRFFGATCFCGSGPDAH